MWKWIRTLTVVGLAAFTASTQTSCSLAAANPKLEIPSWTTEDFYEAIEQNDLAQIQQYLADESRATTEFLSYYMLDYALELERNDAARLMIGAGAGISTLSAVQHGNLAIVKELLNHGVEPRGVSLAAQSGNLQLVKLLLDFGESNINTEGAAKNGKLRALKLLLDAGAEPRGLCSALINGHKNAAELLLQSGADANEVSRTYYRDLPRYRWDYLTPLHCAVISGVLEQVELLLKHGAIPNITPPTELFAFDDGERSRSWTPLLDLATDPEFEDDQIVTVLKESTVTKETSNTGGKFRLEEALYRAAGDWNHDRVLELIEMGAQPSGFGSFYYDYSEQYDPRIIEAFFDAGASPIVYNKYGPMYSPPALTLMNGDVDNYRRFVSTALDSWPLPWYMKIACVNGLTEAIELIWEQGLPRSCGEQSIGTNYGHVHMIEFLLSRGARPVELRRAVEEEHSEIVRMFLEAGADPNESDDFDERSILEVASEKNNDEIIDMLKVAGAHF
ncbi:MAG: ankyrin repeat domain-containing protein [Gammaproteobacteria bacterium]|nr:ankyrin repeat domain-containing protein [Gammaproteobacteria bacterium]